MYVPFDVRRITDEMKINFRVSSNSFARWNINVRQIECGHKAALVTPDVQQGWRDSFLSFVRFKFSQNDLFQLLMVVYSTSMNLVADSNHSILEVEVIMATHTMQFVSIATITRMLCLSMIRINCYWTFNYLIRVVADWPTLCFKWMGGATSSTKSV